MSSSISDERISTSLQAYIGPGLGNRRQIGMWEQPPADQLSENKEKNFQ